MSAEAAALRLGTTVAKTAADLWLGGRRREQERHLSMAELVRVRVPGLRLRRSVERQFGQITDAVFDRLEPYLEHEFRGLDEAGQQAVTDAVCDTFARADLSDEAVLAADANPAELIRRITGSVRAPVGHRSLHQLALRGIHRLGGCASAGGPVGLRPTGRSGPRRPAGPS